MIDFQITLNDAEAKTFLVNAKRKLDETEKPLAASMVYMVGSIKRNFEAQGRPIPWKPLSAVTLAIRRNRKKRKTNSTLILKDRGTLMTSINPGRFGSVTKSGKTEAQVGTALSYAALHQWGGTSTIPAHRESVKAHKRIITMVYGRAISPKQIKIGAFERQMPGRSFNVDARPFALFQNPEDINRIQRFFTQHVEDSTKK